MSDVLVIGGGTNGLAAAGLLARGGKRVVLCEQREQLGGLASGVLHETCELSPAVVEALELSKHGLTRDNGRSTLLLEEDGPGILLTNDDARTRSEIARVSSRDAERWSGYRDFHKRIAPFLAGVLSDAPPDTEDVGLGNLLTVGKKAMTLRRLGKVDMLEVLRVAPMCVADFVREWFESDLLQSGLALPGVSGTWLGPWSSGSAMNLLVHEFRARGRVSGGPNALVDALAGAARDARVELRTGARVEQLLLESGAVVGVRLEGGEELRAKCVLATCAARHTFLDLLPRGTVGEPFNRRIKNFRARGTTGVVTVELSKPLVYSCRPGETFEYARTGGRIDDLERAFDAVKYRQMSEAPFLEIFATVKDGKPMATMLVHYAPHDLDGGWSEAQAGELGDRALRTLARFAPDVTDSVQSREVLTPADIATRFGTPGGHVHHGEHALDQLILRPTPETSRYGTPFPGLFSGGSSNHPGGGLTCEPGRLAAQAILALDKKR